MHRRQVYIANAKARTAAANREDAAAADFAAPLVVDEGATAPDDWLPVAEVPPVDAPAVGREETPELGATPDGEAPDDGAPVAAASARVTVTGPTGTVIVIVPVPITDPLSSAEGATSTHVAVASAPHAQLSVMAPDSSSELMMTAMDAPKAAVAARTNA